MSSFFVVAAVVGRSVEGERGERKGNMMMIRQR